MGVQSLWDLLLTTAKKIQLEELRGQTLAIDASLWLVKMSSIFAELKYVLQSILKKIVLLRKYDIKPVFVFDGIPPSLKRNTLQKRRRSRLQLPDIEIKKKAQIQVLKLLNKQQQPKSKQKTDKGHFRQMTFTKMQELPQELTEIDIMKLQMQSQLLNTEFQLLLSEDQYRGQIQLTLQQFMPLSIDQRLEIVEYYKHHRPRQTFDSSLSCKQLLQKQIIRIEKKSKLTKLQHQLYNKLVTKINQQSEKGYQIISGQYANKKFVQKRKIPEVNKLNQILASSKNKSVQESRYQKNEFPQYCQNNQQEKPQEDYWGFLKGTTVEQFINKGFLVNGKPVQKQQQQEQDDEALFREDNNQIQFTLNISQNMFSNLKSIQKTEQIQNKQIINLNSQNPVKKQIEEYPPHLQPYTAPQIQLDNGNLELKKLLQILGLPYLNAPSEAQAQCAYLQQHNLVHGIITEDSDVFLFGGKNIYRGVFQNNIRYYNINKISDEIGLNRMKCILFALFVGSDYTEGVKGIGMVNAMQILKIFDTVEKIKRFKEWAKVPDELFDQKNEYYRNSSKQQKQFYEFHKNFKKYWYIQDNFPDANVIRQYMNPKVDQSKQTFKFAKPNIPILQTLLLQQFKMPSQLVKQLIQTLQKANQVKNIQPKLTDYYKIESQKYALIKSKRLIKAVQKNNHT